MEPNTITSLVSHLQKGKCILVLGPEFINIDGDNKDFKGSVHNYLAEYKLKNRNARYLSEDGFFFFNDNASQDREEKELILSEVADFYRGLTISCSYEKLARIPFNAVISLSPDTLMRACYDKIEKKCTYKKYTVAGFQDDEAFTGEHMRKPLIYNLCGDPDEEDGLVFIFENLFKFLDRLFQNSPFPNFQARIQNARSFIFVGFSYEKWYLKLIFYLIKKIRTGEPVDSKYAIFDYAEDLSTQKIDFFTYHFGMVFSREKQIDFIDALYESCKKEGLIFDRASPDDLDDKSDERYKILYMAASPAGTLPLQQGPEYYESIEKQLLRPELFRALKPIFKVTANDILNAVNRHNPDLIFLSCHGSASDELILADESNQPAPYPLDKLKVLIAHLRSYHKRLTCIIFSTCQSEAQAKAASLIIPYSIGMRNAVDEVVSNTFTEGFFEGLIDRKIDVKYAYRNGIQKLRDWSENNRKYETIPVLYHDGALCSVLPD
jgi:hypothetical protein